MSDRRWTPEYVRQRLPAEIREVRRAEGKSPDVKPTHSWLRKHGLIGIQNYADRQDKTVDDVLIEECGFEPRERKPLPGTHAETKKLVRQWLLDEEDSFDRLNNTSVENAWTHIRRVMEISREALGSTNLLRPARADAGENVRLIINLYTAMNGEFESEGTRYNYATTLASFYDYLHLLEEVETNPAAAVLPRMGWSYDRESPKQRLEASQVRACWEATKSFDVEDPEKLDTEELREALEEKILILCLAGSGQRTSEPLMTNAQEDVILDRDDPRICFDKERKNGAGTTPIMAGVEYFEQYIEVLKEQGYEMLFPSDLSEDGTRSGTWVRDKIEEIVDRAGVQLIDGSKPTPKHFRQFWYNEYLNAYEIYISKIEDVAEAQSSASAEIVNNHYLANHHERNHFRDFAYEHFEAAFPIDVVISPEEIEAARDADDESDDPQSGLNEFLAASDPLSAAVRKRIRTEHEAAVDSEGVDYPPTPQRTAATCLSLFLLTAVAGVSLALSGLFWINPFTGDIHATAGAQIGALMGVGLIYHKLPEL